MNVVSDMTPEEIEKTVSRSQIPYKLERKGFVSLAVDSTGLPNLPLF